MLEAKVRGTGVQGDVALVLMHFLGGSGREWDEVVTALGQEQRTVAVDMPGFGGSAAMTDFSVFEMADVVEAMLGRLKLGRYVLVGHSMSGKVAMVLARRFLDRSMGDATDAHGVQHGTAHAERLDGLEGLVLVAPSPPRPEPMEDGKREKMLDALGGEVADGDAKRARNYVTKNEERDIPEAVLERTVGEVLKMNRLAWTAWLERGSKEDWAERVGTLDLPAMVVAGEKDKSLGPDKQREYTLPHLSRGEMTVVAGCSHLVPLERPAEMAEILRTFVAGLGAVGKVSVPPAYAAFLAGDRLSAKTREVVEKRMAGPDKAEVLTAAQKTTLKAVFARIIPQVTEEPIDLAGFVEAQLASGKGDGWRYAVLPEDLAAYRKGLDDLAAQGFDGMSPEAQDAALEALGAEKKSAAARWFEELRGDATAAYMAHPATLARAGYSGFGVGGANTPHQGFVSLGIGEVEAWEPQELVGLGGKAAR